MRWFIVFVFFLVSNQVFSQHLTGLVLEDGTRNPINHAGVATLSNSTYTNSTGSFVLNNLNFGDTVKVSHPGYEAHQILYNKPTKADTIVILLKRSSILLDEVKINRIRDYTLDSLNRRKEYAAFYAYKAPKFKDIFISKSPGQNTQYSPFQSSTSSLVGINLLSVVGLLSRNKTPDSRMQKRLLKDEEDHYTDHVFSKEKIQSLTSLKGDSLQNFMNEYRPALKELKQMTDYQLILYIKKSYESFIKTYKHENYPSLKE